MLGIDVSAVLETAGMHMDTEELDAARFEWVDLIIACMDGEGNEKGTHVERIYFDQEWWDAAHKKVMRIYLNGMLPELSESTKRGKKGVRGFRLDKGREVFGADGEGVSWAPEWTLDANLRLVNTVNTSDSN